MAGPGQARFYSSVFVQTSLASGISAGATTFNVLSTTGVPNTPFVVSVDQNLSSEELMLVTNISGLQYTVTRGIGGTSATSHNNGAAVVHVMYAQDLTDASAHIGAFDAVHGLSSGSLVVGTTDTQTLTNKTLTSPALNSPTINTPTFTGTANMAGINSSAEIKAPDFNSSGLTGATSPSRYVGATAGGAPVSGSFLHGDYVVDTLNNTFLVCNSSGTPGAWNTIVNRTNTEILQNKTIQAGVLTGTTTAAAITSSAEIGATDFAPTGLTGATLASRYVGAVSGAPPTSGTFAVGDFVIDRLGTIWVCGTAGTPGTWLRVAPGGIQAAAISTSSNGTATSGTTETLDTVLGTYQFTALAGRRYQVQMNGLIGNSDTANIEYTINIRDSGSASTPTSSSTLVASTQWLSGSSVGSGGRGGIAIAGTYIAGVSGTHTLGMFAVRPGGSGIFTPVGTRELYVVDIGNI